MLIFTARCYVSAVYAVMCLSITCWYYVKMAKHRITQTMPHDSPQTSILMPKILAKFAQGHPKWGDKCRWGRSKSATFNKKLVI